MPDFVRPRFFVRRGARVDLNALTRWTPGSIILMDDTDAVKVIYDDGPYDFVAGMVSENA
jgi:hypothetical protein